PLASGAAMAEEVRRAVARGHRGALMPTMPPLVRADAPHVNDESYEPLWQACEELGIPVCFHAGAMSRMQLAPYAGYGTSIRSAYNAAAQPQTNSFGISN